MSKTTYVEVVTNDGKHYTGARLDSLRPNEEGPIAAPASSDISAGDCFTVDGVPCKATNATRNGFADKTNSILLYTAPVEQ